MPFQSWESLTWEQLSAVSKSVGRNWNGLSLHCHFVRIKPSMKFCRIYKQQPKNHFPCTKFKLYKILELNGWNFWSDITRSLRGWQWSPSCQDQVQELLREPLAAIDVQYDIVVEKALVHGHRGDNFLAMNQKKMVALLRLELDNSGSTTTTTTMAFLPASHSRSTGAWSCCSCCVTKLQKQYQHRRRLISLTLLRLLETS